MNIYAASILVLIDELKKQTKNWQFEPLVVAGDRFGKLIIQKPDKKVKEFFIESTDHTTEFHIKCKRYKSPLRIINIKFNKLIDDINTGTVEYYKVNGWKGIQATNNISKHARDNYPEATENQIIYKCGDIIHIRKTRKKCQGIYTTFKISEFETIERAAKTIVKVLDKSLLKCANYSGNQEKSEKTYLAIAVNLDGHNFMINQNYSPLKWPLKWVFI